MKEYQKTIELYFELKNTPPSTRESYWTRMKVFLTYIQDQGVSLEDITDQDIQQYILFLKRDRGLSAGTINNYISAIRFFHTYVLEKEWNSRKIPRMKRENSFPVIPPKKEIFQLLNATNNLKYKAIFMLIYGSGLRVSEVAQLRIRDISGKNMSIRVDHAKHNTSRYTILSQSALDILREYFKRSFTNKNYQLDDWLFPGRKKGDHLHVKSIKNMVIILKNKLELDPSISAHTLRHCFATHALEDGVDPVFIQQMLGHKNLQTTLTYLHMTSKSMMGIKSPLDTKGDHEE